ncbi:ABC-type multidrug transport system ATPase subunit [Arcicella aurantiaca]|uniref:ABC-type multidrug transport system ATPase subunit n=1 Tax=Arcicella aurantiaca TaxID=591202 RepID=A0A316DZV1_9BACT|nr:ABC transporter ATP-binding protein [Arcicella aurantiaca]PWK16080.1 ABC-type multidrug transport system ATPase subunit [Arcicella aurantiaca]
MAEVIIQNITKTYEKGTVKALDNVSFSVKSGELFGLIGADGAGKSTLFRILTTLLIADSGTATVAGFDVVKEFNEIRKIVGYMPGKFSLYQDLSIEENLNFFATVFGTTVEENYELIREIYVQIEPFKKRLAGQLSGGMKQKLALCCALIHEPKVLFLDEPTTGVDPVSRKEFWEMLERLKERGITIIVSTPYMDEAKLCDRIALIQNSKILDIDTLEGILSKNKQNLFAVSSDKMYQLLKDLRAYPDTISCFAFGQKHHLQLKTNENSLNNLMPYLEQKGHSNIAIKAVSPDIEDTFIKLMQDA